MSQVKPGQLVAIWRISTQCRVESIDYDTAGKDHRVKLFNSNESLSMDALAPADARACLLDALEQCRTGEFFHDHDVVGVSFERFCKALERNLIGDP